MKKDLSVNTMIKLEEECSKVITDYEKANNTKVGLNYPFEKIINYYKGTIKVIDFKNEKNNIIVIKEKDSYKIYISKKYADLINHYDLWNTLMKGILGIITGDIVEKQNDESIWYIGYDKTYDNYNSYIKKIKRP